MKIRRFFVASDWVLTFLSNSAILVTLKEITLYYN